MHAKKLVFVFALIFYARAEASVLIEPYLGFYDGSYSSLIRTEGGTTFGARLGLQSKSFMAGLEYVTGSWKAKTIPPYSQTPQNTGAFLGFKFPRVARLWATYEFNDRLNQTSSAGSNYLTGTGVRLGVGFTPDTNKPPFGFLHYLSFNFEFDSITYTKLSNNGTLSSTGAQTFLCFMVSVPMTL
jgi:hypothetical protein